MKLIKIILDAILYFLIDVVLCAIGLVVLAATLVILIPVCLITMLIVAPLYLAIAIGSLDDVLQWAEENDEEESEEHAGATVDDCR